MRIFIVRVKMTEPLKCHKCGKSLSLDEDRWIVGEVGNYKVFCVDCGGFIPPLPPYETKPYADDAYQRGLKEGYEKAMKELTSGEPDGWCDENELKDFIMGRKTKIMVGSVSELVDKLDMTGPFVPLKLWEIK